MSEIERLAAEAQRHADDAVRYAKRARVAAFISALLIMLSMLLLMAGCDNPCKDGDQRIEATGDVFLCVDGHWVRQDNPNTDPIEALGERVLVVGQ